LVQDMNTRVSKLVPWRRPTRQKVRGMLDQHELRKLYAQGFSMMEIARKMGVSHHKVCYWMEKHNIPRRTRSEATYVKRNPNGDPFSIKTDLNREEAELRGMGLGLYWGEGNKANKTSVRLSNTDPNLLAKFIEFLTRICGVKKDMLKFSLQIFDDMNAEETESFWQHELQVAPQQFYGTTVTKSRGEGLYKNKTRHGVLTLYCHNKKLRDALINMLR
jgi:hypothetical protein